MLAHHITDCIGNTPLLRLSPDVTGLKHIDLYAKLEHMNPFGSVKDRTAWGMLKEHVADIQTHHKTIIEASSGNTAKALATLGGTFGASLHVITNRIRYPEGRHMMKILGVDIEELPNLGECPDPFAPDDAIQYTARKASQNPDDYFYPDQYYSQDNPRAHYETTGKEIRDDAGDIDYFFGFLGTCGTTLGTGQYLQEHNPDLHIYGIISEAGHTIPGGRNANELWEVGLFKQDHYREILQANTQQSIDGLLTLNRACGVMCGPTAGATFVVALQKLKELDAALAQNPPKEKKKAAFIVCDRVEMYMGYLRQHRPDLFKAAPPKYRTLTSLTPVDLQDVPQLTAANVPAFQENGGLVIDTRAAFAFSVGHIAHSFNLAEDILTSLLESESMPFPIDLPLLIVCRVGAVSQRFAALLRLKGYNASSLKNGLDAYHKAELPLLTTLPQQTLA